MNYYSPGPLLNAEQHVLYIISTLAGQGDKSGIEAQLRQIFLENNCPVVPDFLHTEYRGHAADGAKEYAERYGKNAIIYVGGGDGTGHEVAQVLAGGDSYMGILPLGTGNDLCKNLYGRNIPLTELFIRSLRPHLGRADLIKINEEYCLNICSLGYDTFICAEAYRLMEEDPTLGRKGFGKAVMKSLFTRKPTALRISFETVSGEQFVKEYELLLMALCNGSHYGGGFNPAPQAKINDGKNELLLVDELNFFELIPLIYKYQRGLHEGHRKVHTYEVKRGLIESLDGKEILANAEGELFTAPEIRFEIAPNILPFAYI